MLFAAAPWVVDFNAVVIPNGRKVVGIEECSGMGKLGTLVAISKSAARVSNIEGHIKLVARRKRRFKLVDGVECTRAGGNKMKWTAETNIRYRLSLVRNVNLA